MKFNIKFLFPIFISIVIGFLFGKIVFNQYDNTSTVLRDGELVYFIKSGVFANMEDVKKVYPKTENILILNKNNAYHSYVGISLNKKLANKIEEYYQDKGYDIYIEEQIITNEKFSTSLREYDKILNISSTNDDIEIIEKVVIASYKELVMSESKD